MELQWANGAAVSFDHISNTAGEGGGMAAWLSAGAAFFRERQLSFVANPIMTALFPKGLPFGVMGDGSNDRSLVEQEAVVLRYVGPNGLPTNCFFDLAELDLSTSVDGISPDAQCITAAYAESLSRLNGAKGLLLNDSWTDSCIGASFDGASVMLGEQNGVGAKLKAMASNLKFVVHAVAHVEQLAMGDAFKEVEFYEEWKSTMQEAYVYYHRSGKKRDSLEKIAEVLKEDLLKLTGTHGIRWAAAQFRTIHALLVDLPVIVADLERTVKSELGMQFSLLTPSENFIGKTFSQKFEGFARPFKATVKRMERGANGAASDTFFLAYAAKRAADRTEMTMSKAELVTHLTDESDPRLANDARWALRSKLTSWRFVAFSYFMLDVHEQLSFLSKAFQGNRLVLVDIPRLVNKSLRALEKLGKSRGKYLLGFYEQVSVDDSADILGHQGGTRTCHLEDGEQGRIDLKSDIQQVITALNDHISTRYAKVLDNELIQATGAFQARALPYLIPVLTRYSIL